MRGSPVKKPVLVPALLLAASLTACGGSDAAADGDDQPVVRVEVKDMRFSPAEITVQEGQTVEWVFDDGGMPHDVVGDDLPGLESELLTSGTYTYTFTEAGEFGYHCTPHPDMTGTVTVEG